MKPHFVARLIELSRRGNNSPRTSLIIARRYSRHLRDRDERMRSQYRKEAAELKVGLPFTAAKLDSVEAAHKEWRDFRDSQQLVIADWIRKAESALLDICGFDGICDLLAVNPVHREEAREYAQEAGPVTAIAFISGLEDSASTRSGRKQSTWNDGPLFCAMQRQFMRLLIEHPEAFPDPFAPGGPFYGVPTCTMQPDGSMKRNAPALVVHSRDGGQRVVERRGRTS